MSDRNIYQVYVFGYGTLSIWDTEAEARKEADRLHQYERTISIRVIRLPLNKSANWNNGEIIYAPIFKVG